jgi:hypothetical protein
MWDRFIDHHERGSVILKSVDGLAVLGSLASLPVIAGIAILGPAGEATVGSVRAAIERGAIALAARAVPILIGPTIRGALFGKPWPEHSELGLGRGCVERW